MSIVFKKRQPKLDDAGATAIYHEAHSAGQHAAELVITPMAYKIKEDGRKFFYNAPLERGEAWINLPSGAFAHWAHKQKLDHCHWDGGKRIYVLQYGADLDKKRAYARAFADMLKRYGIAADSCSKVEAS